MRNKNVLTGVALLIALLSTAVSCKDDFASHVGKILSEHASDYAIYQDKEFKALVAEGDNAFSVEIDSLMQRGLVSVYDIPGQPVRVIEWRCPDDTDSTRYGYSDFVIAYEAEGKTHVVTKSEFWDNLKGALYGDEDVYPCDYEICEFSQADTAGVYLLHINQVRSTVGVDMDKAGGFYEQGYLHSLDNVTPVSLWIHLMLKLDLADDGVVLLHDGPLDGYYTCGSKDGPVLDEGKAFLGFENGHEWVDLGLPSGNRWAACNLGADTPTAYGARYSWGENHSKQEFTWDNCEMYRVNKDNRPTDISGSSSYDPVATEWGGGWRMPTAADFQELKEHTKGCRSWTTIDGVTGLKLVGPNGNAIFIPAAGYQDIQSVDGLNQHGSYWTANRKPGAQYVDYIALDCWGLHPSYSRMDHGRSVRPVLHP